MRRGEIRLVDFEPAVGAEANKRRPAVIVSNDGANARAERVGRGVLTVVPTTSNTTRLYDFQIVVEAASTGLPLDSKVQAEQITRVDVSRIGRRLGHVSPHDMARVEEALLLHLGM